MPITGSQAALMQARFGLGRVGATRVGHYTFSVKVSIGGTDRTSSVLRPPAAPPMRITHAVNDGISTCSFTVSPTAGLTLSAGQVVIVGFGALSNMQFAGQIESVTARRRRGSDQSPYLDVRCVDYRRLLDRRRVTAEWQNQSATKIAHDIVIGYTSGFSIAGIEHGLDDVVKFTAENDRPSDLLRRLAALVNGGTYVDPGRVVFLYGSSGNTRFAAPAQITNSLATLVDFRHVRDFSQIRTRVICEGKRTRLMLALPTGYNYSSAWNYVPIEDSTGFETANQTLRIGPQRFTALQIFPTGAQPGENPAGTSVRTAAAAGATSLALDSVQFLEDQLATYGTVTQFVKVGEQVIFHSGYSYVGTPSTSAQLLSIPASGFGSIATPIEVDAQVVPLATLNIYAQRINQDIPLGTDVVLYAQADDTSAQSTIAAAEGGDGIHEHVISESGADMTAAESLANAELAAFSSTSGLLEAEWETRDLGVHLGALQSVSLTSPTLSASLPITQIETSIDMPFARPVRKLVASEVRTATLLDVVETNRG